MIFNMDIRTFGKDYEKYYLRARDSEGVRFSKARIHTITEIPETGDLHVQYVDEDGSRAEDTFSMVVLSVGLGIAPSSVELARRLGIELNSYNFVETDPFAPVATSRPGIFTCGLFQGPKDIPGSITEASAAASAAGGFLAEPGEVRPNRLRSPTKSIFPGRSRASASLSATAGSISAGWLTYPLSGSTPRPCPMWPLPMKICLPAARIPRIK